MTEQEKQQLREDIKAGKVNIDDILKTIAKKSYGADDKQAEIFTEMYHQGEKIWNK